jgi:tetratricopeptide (TPR) repeat protein
VNGLRGRLVIVATAGALCLAIPGCGGGPSKRTASPAPDTDARAAADARVAFLRGRAAGDPLDTFSRNALAAEHVQRSRETGDVAELARAEQYLQESLRIRLADNYDGLALLASVKVTQHDFALGADLAAQAIAMKPAEAFAYGAFGDAYMGLGRYTDADFAYEKMAMISPELGALSRKALLFQARGDFRQAEDLWDGALRRAEDNGVPEHAAWVLAQIGNLRFIDGDVAASRNEYERSLEVFPGYVHALAGLGRAAAADGDLDEAIDYYRRAVAAVPLPEYAIALGDVYAAAGDERNAAAQYELVDAIARLYDANGVNLDLQIALFNADHGRDLARTVELARRAFAAQPSIQAADALAWVEYTAGNAEAARAAVEVALGAGSREPLVLFHAGMIYRAAVDDGRALEYLRRLDDQSPRFSVRHAEIARGTLAGLEALVSGR